MPQPHPFECNSGICVVGVCVCVGGGGLARNSHLYDWLYLMLTVLRLKHCWLKQKVLTLLNSKEHSKESKIMRRRKGKMRKGKVALLPAFKNNMGKILSMRKVVWWKTKSKIEKKNYKNDHLCRFQIGVPSLLFHVLFLSFELFAAAADFYHAYSKSIRGRSAE